ncbi:MAG TPA: HAMP domain-containing sensor histidine kinase [Gemmata sp.]
MSRRLLGPVGGPVVFFLVAVLVFAGLGWLTVVALRVEKAQREAAAQAELGNNLRVALWQLDGRVLLQLGGEDARPFYHYSSADPLAGSTAGPTPLLAAPLPDWMKLHVQLDPATGWESPQVLTPAARERVILAWPELPLRNDTAERALALKHIRENYPVVSTCGLLAARDRAIPEDSPPFAAPLFTTNSLQQPADSIEPPASAAKPPPPELVSEPSPLPGPPAGATSDAFRLFGWEFRSREALSSNARDGGTDPKREPGAPGPSGRTAPPGPNPPAQAPLAQAPAVGRGGFSRAPENDRGRDDFWNRAQTIQKGNLEAKNAGSDPLYGKNYQNPLQNNELRNNLIPVPPVAAGQVQPGIPAPPGAGAEKAEKDTKSPGGMPGKPVSPSDFGKFRELLTEPAKRSKDLDALRKLQEEKPQESLTERLAALRAGLERQRCLDEIEDLRRRQATQHPLYSAAWSVAVAACGPPAPQPVPPAEERPVPSFAPNALTNLALNKALAPVVNIHLGSMRPQWITAADGTELLILMRVAKLDGRTVYQGVVLDWAKLEELLRDEVKDLFPAARLVPVKSPEGVQPARAMTALPVQLDTGPEPELRPPGWTPLRFGLVLAWVAAFIAVAAVGLSGWSLIDLAERRIRFVSAVTHELRTPLTSLRLYLDLLTSGMIHDEAKRQEYLNTLAVESDRLHRLVDNVLDFAKLEKRRKNGDLKPVRIAELLEQVQKTWADRVAADGRELVVISTLAPDLEVCTDPVMVHQIVGNLIDNARKYTRDAGDKRIWLWARPDGSKRITFEVEDRGSGVPASERKAIFKPFRRGASADTTAGGAGLGLALAKQWAEVLGGTVAYRPAEGAPGACFRLELPNP